MKKFLFLFLSIAGFCFASPEEQILIEHVKKSIYKALFEDSKLSPEVLKVEGMSGAKGRHFLNNICSLPNATYLEIGSLMGSTLVSALYKNEKTMDDAIAIDIWEGDGMIHPQFANNVNRFVPDANLRVYPYDCFTIDVKKTFLRPVNIYFFDGFHDRPSHEKAFTYFNDAFADVFIAIVDDWSATYIKEATFTAFQKLGYKILFQQEFNTRTGADAESWWNGLYVAVIKKN